MKNHYDKILSEIEDQITELSSFLSDPIEVSESALDIVLKGLEDLKAFVYNKGFKSEEEEMDFFKRLKPAILSKLIYYNSVYKIETKMPYGGEKNIKEYLKKELNKLRRFFDNNLEFYKYYRTNSTYLDKKYFLRGKYDIKLSLDTYYFESDRNFSTSHDFKVAKIIANDLIQVYIEDYLYNKKSKSKKCISESELKWTGSKTSLIELIYALHYQGVFDNGNTDIKLIAKTFEKMFNIELGDFYHTYLELRNRKINRTKFLDTLRDSLNKKMDDQEEK